MRKLYNKINRKELIEKMRTDTQARTTLSFYKYHHILNPGFFRNYLYEKFDDLQVMGRIYLAYEGINAQVSVPTSNMPVFHQTLNEVSFLNNLRMNYAIEDDGKSFFKLIIKVRSKIVADGLHDLSFDASDSGIHLNANEFNQLAEKNNTIIVDMRNHYESEIGHFQNAILPQVDTFREALPAVAEMLQDKKDKDIIMYCTGGIRCEKASAFLKHHGFKQVYQLSGGIIEYARQVAEQQLENKFVGKNFVFDERLGERISPKIISRCHQCGKLSDKHINCRNDQCHILFIQCDDCALKFQECCSRKCAEFNSLDDEQKKSLKGEMVFNGSKFSKSKFKMLLQD